MQPFRQIDNSLARLYEGTGLGLPLTEGLMQLHGGRLTIGKVPGGTGTVATAIFPADRVRAVKEGARGPGGRLALPPSRHTAETQPP